MFRNLLSQVGGLAFVYSDVNHVNPRNEFLTLKYPKDFSRLYPRKTDQIYFDIATVVNVLEFILGDLLRKTLGEI